MEEIAQVYGRSLFEVAREHDKLDEVRGQLGELAEAIDQSRELALFFFSPYFSTEEKKDGLHRAVEGAEEILINFLELLLENHRMPLLFRIRQRYDELWEQEHRLLPVQVTSAIELDEQIVSDLGARIGERTGRRVELTQRVEPDILGGIVVQVGNSILDASIRNRLEQLRKQVARG
ncbi:MAG: ATP synthase F1 subunit delta [Actinobacteria bacterium]|nr:MAG: ATP synthase F1 subunit delta [Actinomycetota bacterium]